jgi:hypothetical protein
MQQDSYCPKWHEAFTLADRGKEESDTQVRDSTRVGADGRVVLEGEESARQASISWIAG